MSFGMIGLWIGIVLVCLIILAVVIELAACYMAADSGYAAHADAEPETPIADQDVIDPLNPQDLE